MINKKFGIYDPVEDMFYMYFGKYSFTDDDEDNRGGTGDAICYLTNIILDRYGMYSHYPHKFLVKVIKTEIEKTFSDIYEKYGPFVSKCCSNKNHVILIASVDKLKRELTIENWGTNYKMPFDDFYSQCEKTYGADNLYSFCRRKNSGKSKNTAKYHCKTGIFFIIYRFTLNFKGAR